MPKRRLPPGVVDAVLALAHEGPSEIERRLKAAFGANAPSLRTIQRILGDEPSEGEAWRFDPAEAEPEDAAVLVVRAYLAQTAKGKRRDVTQAEAEAVRGLFRVAPDLPAALAWHLARGYVGRVQRSLPTAGLDDFLAFAPWRSDEAASRYVDAYLAGWIDELQSPQPGTYRLPGEAAARLVAFEERQAMEAVRRIPRPARRDSHREPR